MSAPDLRSRLLAILVADVAGYSRLMSLDERATVAALDAGRTVFREQVVAHGGRVIDMAGDSVLSVFDTAIGAMNAALAVQRHLAAAAVDVPDDRRLRYRIGIHVGDVFEKADGTVYGDSVNIAARLEGLAVPGAVAVSQAVFSMVARRVDAVFDDIGDRAVKNIAQPVRAYQARLQSPGELATLPTSNNASPRQGNIPDVLPPLIGRADDVVSLTALVKTHRVVSIVGAGGIGKTRLAQATAHTLRHDLAAGVWMVELAPVADPALLSATVAQTLGVSLAGHRSAQDEVIDVLRDREILLVLDNCEHILDAASAFTQALVDRAPKAHLLITSQELLKIADEHIYRVAPLPVPSTPDLSAARTSAAVDLMVSRVRAQQPAFEITDQNAPDLIEICRRLDGLPLAIELAAARIPLLGVAGVRERLNERFRVLTGGARNAPRRLQALREALDWSHSLLAPDERAIFRRAGVFAGSFTMAAAQSVLGDSSLDNWAVLEHVGALVDKSLVTVLQGEPPRYRLLESARAYALEKLGNSGETEVLKERHARAMVALFDEGLAQRWTLPWSVRIDRHLQDIDNLRAALDWVANGPAELHIALAGASAWIWSETGHRDQALHRCEQALRRIDATTRPEIEARLLSEWCLLPISAAGETEVSAAERACELYRQLGDELNLFLTLERLALACARSGRLEPMEQALLEMTRLHNSTWPPASQWHIFYVRANFLLASGQLDDAHLACEDCLRRAATHGETRSALMLLERSAARRGDFAEAVARGRALFDLVRNDRFERYSAIVLSNLSAALTELGELEEALALAREAMAFQTQSTRPLWLWLVPFGLLAYKLGRVSDAARAVGRADVKQSWAIPFEKRQRDKLMTLLESALMRSELEALMREGAILCDEDAVRVTLGT